MGEIRGRPVVLALLAGFWPGHEANGPSQSLLGLCSALGDRFDFRIIARDRPFGATGEGLAETNIWIERPYARVLYCRSGDRRVAGLARALRETPHDLLLLNSFFDPEMTLPTLAMRRVGLIPRRPALLAPRGELSPGALSIKPVRKHAYMSFAKGAGLLRAVRLLATSMRERDEIAAALGNAAPISLAPNLRPPLPAPLPSTKEKSDVLRLAYLSRIDRKKNLDFAIRALNLVDANVRFDIWGPITEEAYWRECQALLPALPSNIEARYCGPIAHAAVHQLLATYDALFLPTRSENFGHAIVDAFAAGCPALISDQTPWVNLEKLQAGWSLPLGHPGLFAEAIERLAALSPDGRRQLRAGARRLAEAIERDSDAAAANRRAFEEALATARAS